MQASQVEGLGNIRASARDGTTEPSVSALLVWSPVTQLVLQLAVRVEQQILTCVSFHCMSMLRPISSSVCYALSKKGRLSPLTSSLMNLMLLSTALVCFEKAFTSFVLILTHASSANLNQWVGAVPAKVV